MKPHRIEIARAMLLNMAVAADCVLVLLTVVSDVPAVGVASVVVLMTSNLFALAIQPLVRPRGPLRPFLLGFVVHGLVAMAALLGGIRLLRGELVDHLVRPFLRIDAALADALPRAVRESAWVGGTIEVALVAVLFGLPMLGYAAFGGLLCTGFAGVAVPHRPEGDPPAGGPGR
jgi:hypothetical protein